MVVSSELDPSSSVTGVWEIGCSLAADGPIVLTFCVVVPKRSFYEDLVVVLVGFVCSGLQKLQKSGKNSAIFGPPQ